MIQAAVISGVVGIALGVYGAASLLNARHERDVLEIERLHTASVTAATERAASRYQQLETQKNDALKAAQILIDRNRADAGAARAERDGLRADLARVPARIAAASRAAVDEYAATQGVVLEQCTERYTAVAGNADGHAVDAGALEAAWPR